MIGGRPNTLFGLIPPTFAPMEDIAGGGPATAPATPFQWGAGGNRLTPEDIAFQRRLAAQNASAGMDASPVGHWTQGLARVAQSVAGLLQNRRLDKAADQNALDTQAAIGGLNGSSGGPSIASILANPYIDEGVKDAAKLEWQATHRAPPQPTEFERSLAGANITPGTPEYVTLMRQFVENKANPLQAVPGVDAQGNQVLRFIRPNQMQQGGGDPVSTGPAGASPPTTLPPDFDFGNGGAPQTGARTFPLR